MAVSHGKSAVVQLDNAAGSLTDITGKVVSITFTPTADSAETSVLGLTSKTYVPGLKDCTVSINGIYDATIAAIINSALGNSTTKSLQYDPQGSGSGNDRWTCETFGTSFSVDTNLGGAATFTLELQVTGNVTLATI